jgi:hypothetical protein
MKRDVFIAVGRGVCLWSIRLRLHRGLKDRHAKDLKPSTEHLKTPPIPDRTERDPYGYLVLTKTIMKST